MIILDVDECKLLDVNNCTDTTNCINTSPGFYCQCKTGYENNNGTHCEGERLSFYHAV